MDEPNTNCNRKRITVYYSWKCPLYHIKTLQESDWWKVLKNHFWGEQIGKFFPIQIQPKTFNFFILFRYAIWTKSTSLIPNMKSVFLYHVPFPRYRGPTRSNFGFLTYFGQLNGGLHFLFWKDFYLDILSRLNRPRWFRIWKPFFSITYRFWDTGGPRGQILVS